MVVASVQGARDVDAVGSLGIASPDLFGGLLALDDGYSRRLAERSRRPNLVVKSELEPIGLLRFVLTAALSVLPACSGGDGPIATICDGSTAIRFSFRNIGGGQVLPGSQVLSENGFNFLIVDGQCHFWARPDQDSDAREGDLSEERANRLSSTLKLSSWGKLRGDYTDSLCDGPTREYRFADSKIAVYSTCAGGSSPVNWLLNPALSQLQAIYDTGTPVGGPVRFVLMAEQDGVVWSSSVINLAAHWPLASDPASVAWSLIFVPFY